MGTENKINMQQLWDSSMLDAGSAAWLEGLYEIYLSNPNQVENHWREFFDTLPRVNGLSAEDVAHSSIREQFRQLTQHKGGIQAVAAKSVDATSVEHERKQVKVLQLINAYRFRGHQNANLDPLKRKQMPVVDELDLKFHGLSDADFNTVFSTGSLVGPEQASLQEIYSIIRGSYCSSIGTEYMHIAETEEKRWIQQRIESVRGKPALSKQQKNDILNRLTAAEGLEKYLHTKYVGQKRFSLEGGETLIPLLDELIERAGSH
ncbi:MAG: 2-oxoglutarate dehydrogenase E1 component, partial [Gammaproteobacteria bacterium]|nr:2-oxoglutarate dehydrogenase E1 component [Gammaproteobacteria bacterium]